jgi:hypothetical protein
MEFGLRGAQSVERSVLGLVSASLAVPPALPCARLSGVGFWTAYVCGDAHC